MSVDRTAFDRAVIAKIKTGLGPKKPRSKKMSGTKEVFICLEDVKVGKGVLRPCGRVASQERHIVSEILHLCPHHAEVWDAFWGAALTNDGWDDPIIQQAQLRVVA